MTLLLAAAQSGSTATGGDAAPPTGGGISAIGTLTTIHFVLIAALALLTICGIIYGVRQKRLRAAAEREEQTRMEEFAQSSGAAGGRECLVAPSAPPLAAGLDAPIGTDAATPVTALKGLGPKVAARLQELGITHVGQIAALTDDEAEALDAKLGAFSGRVARDRWIEQARFLAAGDRAGFEAVFGKL